MLGKERMPMPHSPSVCWRAQYTGMGILALAALSVPCQSVGFPPSHGLVATSDGVTWGWRHCISS